MNLMQLEAVSVYKPGSKQECLVDSIDCAITAGEILVIIGPNGAGKSSLLKAITGEWTYSGKIKSPLLSTDPKLRASQVAVLPQLSLLNFPYTVSEVVMLGRIPHETGREHDQKLVLAALEMMDISFLRERLYTELSGGEKQRVQLARILTQIWSQEDAQNSARLLILDEPTTALDLGHQHALMQAVQVFAQQGVAVVMVLHDINLAAQYADQMLAILCSQTIAYGSPKDVISKENMQRLFSVEVDIVEHPNKQYPMVISL